jgi:type II secretory pathway pseudopilin PulG
MENLIHKVGRGIGKGVAVGLLGLTLGLGVPAVAMADNNNKTEDFFRALRLIEGVTDKVQDRMDEQAQEQQNQQYQAQQQEQAQEQAQAQEQYQEQQKLQKEREEIQQYQASLPKNQIHYFACNSLRPDGTGIYPIDYVGIKSVFKLTEPLLLIDYNPSSKTGDIEKVDVYGPKGELIVEVPLTLPSNGSVMEVGIQDGSDKFTRYLAEKEGFGNYRAVWSLNNEVVGEDDFTINP